MRGEASPRDHGPCNAGGTGTPTRRNPWADGTRDGTAHNLDTRARCAHRAESPHRHLNRRPDSAGTPQTPALAGPMLTQPLTITFLRWQDDGSLLSVVLNGVCVALLHAGIPLRGMLAGCSVALLPGGAAVLDPTADEVAAPNPRLAARRPDILTPTTCLPPDHATPRPPDPPTARVVCGWHISSRFPDSLSIPPHVSILHCSASHCSLSHMIA